MDSESQDRVIIFPGDGSLQSFGIVFTFPVYPVDRDDYNFKK